NRVRAAVLDHFRRAARGALPLRLAGPAGAALHPGGVLLAAAGLRGQPLRAGSDSAQTAGYLVRHMAQDPLTWEIVLLAVLLVMSGFFSIAETSMMAVNRYRLKALVRMGNRGAKLATELLAKTDKLLG